MAKKKKSEKLINNDEATKNLLIVSLLHQDVDPKVIEIATGIPEMTIRGKFPMHYMKKKSKSW